MSEAESRFCIMACSDSHLGYKEKDQIQANDSFSSFAEALSM